MVCSALVVMAANPPEPLGSAEVALPVVVIVCREIAMSALREWAAAASSSGSGIGGGGGGPRSAVKVNSLGKWKTALQLVAMIALLSLRHAAAVPGGVAHILGVPERHVHALTRAALAVLWAGALLAVVSLYYYMASVWRFFLYPGTGGPPPPSKATTKKTMTTKKTTTATETATATTTASAEKKMKGSSKPSSSPPRNAGGAAARRR